MYRLEKYKRLFGITIIFIVILSVYTFFNGSIIKKYFYKKEFEDYLINKYQEEIIFIGDVKYDFKTSNYSINAYFKSSPNFKFTIYKISKNRFNKTTYITDTYEAVKKKAE